ncbi:MAG TPA: alpha-N-arabinofuranosidase [Terriglobia bacterium]|nr:alpha-N-arabinofuranosidase [Terriglobia bacterium]
MKRFLALGTAVCCLVLSVKSEVNGDTKNRLIIEVDQGRHIISRHIYGHFSEHLGHCIYGGVWVGEDSAIPNVRGIRKDVVEALREIKIPNLRWPGGCFADTYHWTDGVGPRQRRPSIVNTNWGGVTEDNHFGTHEFMDLCEQLGCEPYICGNVGSGTVRELQQWVEYLTFNGRSPMADLRRANGRNNPWSVRFWGVGNEAWGCGGNMRPEYYADVFRRFVAYLYDYKPNRIYKIASGPSDDSYAWTETLMREAGQYMNGLGLHYYTVDGSNKGSATQFDETGWFKVMKKTLFMKELIERHSTIMDRYDPGKRVGLVVDEWGTWYEVEPGTNPGFLYQQNTLRDALVAAINLNIFNNHCERVHMANIAQMVNVLQAVILTQDEKMVLTPTYHVFDLYQVHQEATSLPIQFESADYSFKSEKIPAVSVSASRDSGGRIHVTFCNLDPHQSNRVIAELRGANVRRLSGQILTAKEIGAHNTFEAPNQVQPANFDGIRLTGSGFEVMLPSKSVVALELE